MAEEETNGQIESEDLEDDDQILLKVEVELHEAARTGDVSTVNNLIHDRINVNCMNERDRTALHLASGQGHVEVVQALLNAGAKVDAEDKFGMNALLWAAWFGQKDALRSLVNGGANIKCENKQKLTILHCAAQRGHVDCLKYIIEHLIEEEIDPTLDEEDAKPVVVKINMKRLRAQQQGTQQHSTFIEEKLPRTFLELPNIEAQGGRTPLHLAAEHGQSHCVEYLIEAGANKLARSKDGSSVLNLATAKGHIQTVEILLNADISIEERDENGKTALHVAAEEGFDNICRVLLQRGADVNAETNKEMSPLHLAALSGHVEVIKVLLEYSCDLESSNNHNNTPLHLAAAADQCEVAQQLIDAGSNINALNAKIRTPLHCATENALAHMVEVLLIAKADVNVVDKSGKTALQIAARGEHISVVDMIIKADRFFLAKISKNEIYDQKKENIQFKKFKSEDAKEMRSICFKLATKQLKEGEWKRLAFVWGFKETHVSAIEDQFTGAKSWKEHGYRMLLIWLHGCEENLLKGLYEGLVAIGRKELADHIRRKANSKAAGDKSGCLLC